MIDSITLITPVTETTSSISIENIRIDMDKTTVYVIYANKDSNGNVISRERVSFNKFPVDHWKEIMKDTVKSGQVGDTTEQILTSSVKKYLKTYLGVS